MKVQTVESLKGYAFLAPFMLVFIVFMGYPVVYSLWLSAYEVTPYSNWYDVMNDMEYVGLGHYISLLQDIEFWWSLFLTFIYGILTIPTTIALSLGLAILLNNRLKGRNFFRSAFFLPNVLDLFVIGIIWILIYTPQYGLLDAVLTNSRSLVDMLGITAVFKFFIGILEAIGIVWVLEQIGVVWLLSEIGSAFSGGLLSHEFTCLPAIAVAMVLKGAGFGMILFLTAINNISESVYEAAEMDGASKWQKLYYVTLPLVKPIVLFMVITGTIACLTAFTEIYAMTSNTGGPTVDVGGKTMRAANLSGYYLYRSFRDGYYGKAAAISFVLLVIALAISLVNMKWLQKKD